MRRVTAKETVTKKMVTQKNAQKKATGKKTPKTTTRRLDILNNREDSVDPASHAD